MPTLNSLNPKVTERRVDQLLRAVEDMPLEWVYRFVPEMYASITGRQFSPIWNPINAPQMQALDTPADELFYGGAAGGGKGQPLDAPILTPTGYKPMGSIHVGTKVCNPDGQACKVIGVYPLGKRQTYKVKFHDRTWCEVTDDHLWLAWKSKSRTYRTKRLYTTSAIIEEMGKGVRFNIPITNPVNFTLSARHPIRPVDPYFLGVILGGGCIGPKRINIISADPAIPEKCVERTGIEFNGPCIYGTRCPDYRVPKRFLEQFQPHLEKWGLWGSRSGNKFIPNPYLYGTTNERWELLRGLMDTDGWANANSMGYCSKSKQLALDVAFLARSLGGFATWRKGKHAFHVRMKFPDNREACSLERKQIADPPQTMSKRIKSIKPFRTVACQCIQVNNPNGLYLTNDFTVTHNTDLMLGLAMTRHHRSLFLRRVTTDLNAATDRAREIIRYGSEAATGTWKSLGAYAGTLTMYSGRTIKFGGCQHEMDKHKYMGNPYDLYCFDELSNFTRSQYQFIIGWNRTTVPGQRCRVVCGGNPPTETSGHWVIEEWAPWLDEHYPNPAEPGELRWYTTVDGEVKWLDDGTPFRDSKGELVTPRSRTFIPARLEHNPILEEGGYRSVLQKHREPYRSMLLYGDMSVGLTDDPWQIIPTDWVRQAMARWTADGKPHRDQTKLAMDVSRGGSDQTILGVRHSNWVDRLIKKPGREVPTGEESADLVRKNYNGQCPVYVDITGGWGGAPYDLLRREFGKNIVGINFGHKADAFKDRATKTLKFRNKRAAMWWNMYELLDPRNGFNIMLPPDPELKSDLTAPRYSITPSGILVESKEELSSPDRLGRSPDCGDTCVMLFWEEPVKKLWVH